MRKIRYIGAIVVMFVCSFDKSQAWRGAGELTDIAVVVNASNPTNDLTLPQLRNMLTGDRRFWNGNVRIKLVLREPGTRERDAVIASVLKIDNKAFAAQWRARIFRGEASDEPLSVSSCSQVEQYLLENPGGITFMTGVIPKQQLKVLRLDGKLPGEIGYPIR